MAAMAAWTVWLIAGMVLIATEAASTGRDSKTNKDTLPPGGHIIVVEISGATAIVEP
jgi:membrane protein implicated in regulation of membrane protease activity